MISQKEAKNYLESYFFKTTLKVANPEESFDLMDQFFLVKPVKWDKY